MADAGRHDLDQHLALLGALEVQLDDLERFLGFERDGRAGLHELLPPMNSGRHCHCRSLAPMLEVKGESDG